LKTENTFLIKKLTEKNSLLSKSNKEVNAREKTIKKLNAALKEALEKNQHNIDDSKLLILEKRNKQLNNENNCLINQLAKTGMLVSESCQEVEKMKLNEHKLIAEKKDQQKTIDVLKKELEEMIKENKILIDEKNY
jgi:transcriptional regulator with GAF, ATPase, and Fis domain